MRQLESPWARQICTQSAHTRALFTQDEATRLHQYMIPCNLLHAKGFSIRQNSRHANIGLQAKKLMRNLIRKSVLWR